MHKYGKALVVGCGRSGRAAEALLRSEGTTVTSICQEITPDYCFKGLHFDPDVAIISPGFSLNHPWIKELIEHGIPLLSELELGWSRRHCPVIAVTGSNGKSTVVKWIVESLAQAGQTAVPCGNYGFPVCGAVMLHEVPNWLVIEVSSFQLETVQEFRPEIGLLLNVLPNHLDRHGSMDTYRDLKLRLFENMTGTDTAVIPGEMASGIRKKGASIWKTFGTESAADFRYQNGQVGEINLNGTRFANEILGAAGAAVAAVCASCGISPAAVEASARVFEPLPHRTELVAEINGVNYVDDSKATNIAAMCAAVKMCTGKVHLIAGGRVKETDFSLAKDLLAQRVSHLYLIGEASGMMQAAWGDAVRCISCGTLENAVIAAQKQARPGETVLLSPACTSFDQFRDFNERGDCFAAAVRGLTEKNASV
ncbi:MAG: UDP-N-acetylmuramoyl-L-alanine--D-glutamate ligase [Kiritimatiellaceae bacterium]|nr:UDP-N-acetylmuramoyl-L-alanine--D-glutamate ligase [Kiritimatiellaceae bacterium]